jgi:peptidoglycan-N-acetylglucosamine deacetylase
LKLYSTFRLVRYAVPVAALVASVALVGCAHVPASRVTRSVQLSASAGASRLASSAVSAAVATMESGLSTSSAVTPWEIDGRTLLGGPLTRGARGARTVAITLDDGPSKNSAEVLSIFRRYGLRCTFFYVGNRTPRYRGLVRAAYDEGFEIGDHTWDHQELKNESRAFDLAEIDRCQTQLQGLTGHRPLFVRPPSGHWDRTGLDAISARRLVMALWSLHGHDTGPGTHAGTIARGVLDSASGGDVILLHETNPETVKALPAIIEGLRAKGLTPVTLSELLRR